MDFIKIVICRNAVKRKKARLRAQPDLKICSKGIGENLPNEQSCTRVHCSRILSRIRDKSGCLERIVISNKAINTAFHTTSVQKLSR